LVRGSWVALEYKAIALPVSAFTAFRRKLLWSEGRSLHLFTKLLHYLSQHLQLSGASSSGQRVMGYIRIQSYCITCLSIYGFQEESSSGQRAVVCIYLQSYCITCLSIYSFQEQAPLVRGSWVALEYKAFALPVSAFTASRRKAPLGRGSWFASKVTKASGIKYPARLLIRLMPYYFIIIIKARPAKTLLSLFEVSPFAFEGRIPPESFLSLASYAVLLQCITRT